MKKMLFVILILLYWLHLVCSNADNRNFNLIVDSLKTSNGQILHQQKILSKDIQNLLNNANSLRNSIDSLGLSMQSTIADQNKFRKSIDSDFIKIKESTSDSINENRINLSKRTLVGLISLIGLLLLILVVTYFVGKRMISNKSEIEIEIIKTRKALEEEGLNLDNKLVELIDKQLYVLQNSNANDKNADEIDHSLALKVADEIIRIQMNLAHMDPDIKGHKQLSRAVTAILDNFNAYGYEIPDLLNKPYNDNMKVVATMVPDENLAHGTQIITRIVKPIVIYKGVVIQSAQAVVSYKD
jgi:hypothetical protein